MTPAAEPRPAAVDDDRGPVVTRPRRTLEALLGIPFTEGNALDIYRDGGEFFADLVAAIRSSRRTVDLLWFIWGRGDITGEVAEALADRGRAGVRVRVLLDGFGARDIDRDQLTALEEAGCQVAFYRPLRTLRMTSVNLRTHRRALVCDETVAFTGGAGIDVAWTGRGDRRSRWRDTSYRVRGPAVEGLRAAFAMSWLQTPHPLVSDRDLVPVQERAGAVAMQVLPVHSQPGWNSAALALRLLVDSATQRIRVATPYARVPDSALAALTAAVRRGVQVQVMTPAHDMADYRFARVQEEAGYEALLEAGIEIWHYQPSMLHAKSISVDGALAMIGTTNLDTRSLALNEQVAIVVDDRDTVATIDRHYDDDLAVCHRLDAREWAERGRGRRALEQAASTLAQPMRGLGRWQLTSPRP